MEDWRLIARANDLVCSVMNFSGCWLFIAKPSPTLIWTTPRANELGQLIMCLPSL